MEVAAGGGQNYNKRASAFSVAAVSNANRVVLRNTVNDIGRFILDKGGVVALPQFYETTPRVFTLPLADTNVLRVRFDPTRLHVKKYDVDNAICQSSHP